MHKSELQVRSACGQSWDEMRGGARRRFCEACQHDVVNLSALTEKEAAALVARAGAERLCVRYVSDAEGRVRFRAEPSEAAGIRGHIAAGALVALTRTAAPLIPVSALLPACAATPAPAPELPAPPSVAPPSVAPELPAPPSVAPPSPAPAPRPQPATTESSITDPTLGSAGAIVVQVRSLDRHALLADAVVSVSSAALKSRLVAATGEDGKVVFKGLPPADYTIQIDFDAYRPYARSTTVSAGHASTLEVGLVEDPEGMTTVGEIVAVPTVTVTNSSQQGVRLDQSFVSRLPLR